MAFWGRRCRRRRLTLRASALCLSFPLCVFILTLLIVTNNNIGIDTEIKIDLSNNYFQRYEKLGYGNLLVNTTQCKIPDMGIWGKEIRPSVEPPTDKCAETFTRLTYVEKDTVVIDEEALDALGYTLEQVNCCYTSVETVDRDEQARESLNMNTDNVFRYSYACVPMGRRTKSKFMFIKVTCKSKGLFGIFSTFYTNFHMVATFPDYDDLDEGIRSPNRGIARKLKWWRQCLSNSQEDHCVRFREIGRPPNILIIGLDSISRANFYRFLPKTADVLENFVDAVEMIGFNKVGENIVPNFGPMSTSRSHPELRKECFISKSTSFHDCSFLWKQFSALNYLTGHIEDAPEIDIFNFNFNRAELVQSPIDIYPRALILDAYKGNYTTGCIGYERPEEMILNYVSDFVEIAESKSIPYFLTTWITDLTHGELSNLQLADVKMANVLKNLNEKGLLENTFFVFVSDHGYRFQEIRLTTPRWFEDRLPTLWMKLGSSLVDAQSSWLEALQYNSRMLVTPFDIYTTLWQILETYGPSFPSQLQNKVTILDNTEDGMFSSRGLSLFRKVPARTCDQAGIPQDFCSCIAPSPCKADTDFIKSAAVLSLETSINSIIPRNCTQLKVDTVTACGTIDRRPVGVEEISVLVAFNTTPGNFLFEAVAHYSTRSNEFTKAHVLGQINGKVSATFCLVKYDDWIELCHYSLLNIVCHIFYNF